MNKLQICVLKILLFTTAIIDISFAKDQSKGFAMTLPIISYAREAAFRFETNLDAKASLALEGIRIMAGDDYTPTETEEYNGDTLMTDGYEFALYVARYTDPVRLGGFFWAFGAGYRKMNISWHRTPGENYALADPTLLDENGRLNHELNSEGATGHAQIGYRFVAQEWPLLFGIHVGLRHFQGKYQDVQYDEDQDNYKTNPETTDQDRLAFRNRFMTRLEPGINFGFVF